MTRWDGRRACVTGASAGIGRAAAAALAARGAHVELVARRGPELEEATEEIRSRGGHASFTPLDLADTERLKSWAQEYVTSSPVHILVNNVSGPAPGALLTSDVADLHAGMTLHLAAAQTLVQSFEPGMRDAGFGRIINVLSTSVREPIPNLGVSNTIRAAMAGWSKTLSRELAPGITINNVLPGFTDTERLATLRAHLAERRGISEKEVEAQWLAGVPEGRLARPEEVAAAIEFLASPEAGFIRGVNLAVDGGRTNAIA